MSRLQTAVGAAALVSVVVVLAGCEEDPVVEADGADGADGPSITLEAQTPEPLPPGFDPEQCAILVAPLTSFADLVTRVSPEALIVAIQNAAISGDMSGVNEAGVELNTVGAEFRDKLDAAAELVDNSDAADGLSGMAEYYEDYQSVVAQMMASATDWEQLSEDATAVTQSSAGLHDEAEIDASVYEHFVEIACSEEIDVYTAPGIATAG